MSKMASAETGGHQEQTTGVSWYFLLQDSFSTLDLALAIEALKEANRMNRRQVFYGWSLLSDTGAAVRSSNGRAMEADSRLIPLRRSDRLVVLGGGGSQSSPALPAWLRRQSRQDC